MREILLLLSLFCVGFQSSDVLRSVNGTASKCKHFSRLPPKSVALQEALWQDTLREGSVRALCQGREYNSSGLTCHLKEAVRARNSIERNRFNAYGRLRCGVRPRLFVPQQTKFGERASNCRIDSLAVWADEWGQPHA